MLNIVPCIFCGSTEPHERYRNNCEWSTEVSKLEQKLKMVGEQIEILKDKLVVAEEALKDYMEYSENRYLDEQDQDDVYITAAKALKIIHRKDKT